MADEASRKLILARRQRLVAAALAGLGAAGATGCSQCNPRPCLEPMAVDPSAVPSASAPPDAAGVQTVVGLARNAKAGAVVVRDDVPFYLEGLAEWPEEVHGQRVEVRGRVVTRQGLDPIPPDEPQKAGIIGPYQVIEAPVWKLVP